ncbi:MAG: VIT1/CCC1 family protein [Victivallaceae bacterium]|jgi:VIT1/CCC1 family predicted Fe2+/Mn2+ transporter
MDALRKKLLKYQKNEITEHLVYMNLANQAKGNNAVLLKKIADDELRHYYQFREFTGQDIRPDKVKVFFYSFITVILGLTFTLKMMENGEEAAEENYETVEDSFPEIQKIILDEVSHEQLLLAEVDDERLNYLGSIALALNNSAQEFTGIAVGLTFALQNAKATGSTTLVSGLAATLAMMASEYLSQKTESREDVKGNPFKAALYAGGVYLFMVLLIVTPYFIFPSHIHAMLVTVAAVFIVMVIFSFFMSVVKDLRFSKVLLEGLAITVVVVIASYVIGIMASKYLGLGR